MVAQDILDRIADNLADIGAVELDDYLNDELPAAPCPQSAPSQVPEPDNEPADPANAVTRLHQACQRAFRNTSALKFEFVEQTGPRNKQCILTITKPDAVRRSYATQPVFTKKSEAKLEAAKIAVDMGALEFLAGKDGDAKRVTSSPAMPNAAPVPSEVAADTAIDDIEQCCREWRADLVTPNWVPFLDTKSARKQGCALRIQLSSHVARVYLSDPTFDTCSDAKTACAKAAVVEGVLDFIKYGNGQTHPLSPSLPSTSLLPPVAMTTSLTLQGFYDSLPQPFPEPFDTNDAFEINAPAWLNTMVQNAKGGKLGLSFFFPCGGPPGLHGCLLKLDRPGEYKAFFVDARFIKRTDAKAAVCLQAMSEGIGDYVRSITTAVDTQITPAMRSFSSSFVYPALMTELGKIDAALHPNFEYNRERDAFGATMVVKLSSSPGSEQVGRYAVPSDYRSKADAKVAVICRAAEQGVVEFVRFRGGPLPVGYQSPYDLVGYDPERSRKRKQPESADDAEQGRAAKKKKKKRGKKQAVAPSCDQGDRLTLAMPLSSGGHRSGKMDDIAEDGACDSPRPGQSDLVATRPLMFGRGARYDARMYAPSYPGAPDARFVGDVGLSGRGYGVCLPPVGGYDGVSHPPRVIDVPHPGSGPSRAWPGASLRAVRRPAEDGELEPGEVVSSAESEFSESSSRGGDRDSTVGVENERLRSEDKVDASTTSHVKQLIGKDDYCATHGRGTPSFDETESEGRFRVWIVIGKERFDLPTTYRTAEEGRQRVAKQVLVRLSKGS